jgi:hypothetical protein
MQVLNLHPSARFGIEGQEELIDAQRVDSDTPRAREGGPKLAAVERTAMLMRLGEEDLDQQTFGVGAPRDAPATRRLEERIREHQHLPRSPSIHRAFTPLVEDLFGGRVPSLTPGFKLVW